MIKLIVPENPGMIVHIRTASIDASVVSVTTEEVIRAVLEPGTYAVVHEPSPGYRKACTLESYMLSDEGLILYRPAFCDKDKLIDLCASKLISFFGCIPEALYIKPLEDA